MKLPLIKIAAVTCMALAAPAQAALVLQDNFDSDNGGATGVNYDSFANWDSVGAGGVDLVAMPDYGLTCAGGSGSCVDMDGSAGPGRIQTRSSFAFNAGDRVTLTYDLSGSQRGNDTDLFNGGFVFDSPTDILNFGSTFNGASVFFPTFRPGRTSIFLAPTVAPDMAFSTNIFYFTAASAGMVRPFFANRGADGIGPILDNVSLDISAPVPEPASWAMMIVGFVLAGSALRRRASRASFAKA